MRNGRVLRQLGCLLLCAALLVAWGRGFAQSLPVVGEPEDALPDTAQPDVSSEAEFSGEEDEESSAVDDSGAPESSGGEWEPEPPSGFDGDSSSSGSDLASSAEDEESADHDENNEIADAESTPDPVYLEEGEVVVYSFAQLRELVQADNGLTTFYFGADILYETDGAIIHPSKQHVVFSGLNPLDEAAGPHTVTDRPTSRYEDTVRITSSTSAGRSITVRDMEIKGRNYYTPFCVEASIQFCDTFYERVTYDGPQFAHNRWGLVYIEDCDVTLVQNGASEAQELAEAARVEFAGSNRVFHTSGTRVIYFATGVGSVTFLDGAELDLELTNRDMCFVYGNTSTLELGAGARFIYRAPGRFNETALTALTIGEGAELDITCTGVTPEAICRLEGNITIGESGTMRVRALQAVSYCLLRLNGSMEVKQGGVFHAVAEQGTTYLVEVHGGGMLHFFDPDSVLFYNPARNTFGYGGTRGFLDISAQQINYWRAPSGSDPGGLDDPPERGWRKADGSMFELSGSVSINMNGNFLTLDSNYEEDDPPGEAPNSSNFSLPDARLLAFGRIDLSPDPVIETSPTLTGETKPEAAVRASWTAEEDLLEQGISDEDGRFELELLDTVPEGTVVQFVANRDALFVEANVLVGESRLEVTIPSAMSFGTQPLVGTARMVPRASSDWSIVVNDSRSAGNRWQLSVRLEQPFAPENPLLPTLRNALVFVDERGVEHTLLEEKATVVAARTSESVGETTTLAWAADRGILARIPGGEGFLDQSYTAVIRWNIADVP